MGKIPAIDFSQEGLKPGTSTWLETCNEVRRALEEDGCFEAIYTGFPCAHRDQIFSVAEQLFDLPKEVKIKNKTEPSFCGYLHSNELIPLYESFAVHDPNTAEGIQSFTNLMWPDGNDRFSASTRKFSDITAGLCQTVMRMLFESYGAQSEYDHMIKSMKYLLRYIKYRKPESDETKVGLSAHTDKGLIAVVHQGPKPGLQVRTKDGQWVDVEPSPSSFMLVAGDLLMAWSNDRIPACYHRVVMLEEEDRYSLAMFTLGNGTIHVPKEMVDETHPLKYKSFEQFGYLNFCRTQEDINSPFPPIKAYCGI